MNRLLATLGVVALAGAVVGWFLLPGRFTPREPHDHNHTAQPLVEISRRWPLLPTDVKSEKDPPVVAVDSRGRVLVAWSSQTGEAERTLFLARSEDEADTFEKPVAFRKVGIHRHTFTGRNGKTMTHPTSAQPRLASYGESILLGWTEAPEGGPHVNFFVAATKDGGKTFSEPTRVHTDAAVRPSYTALAAGADGTFTVAWLDGRNGSQQLFSTSGKIGGPTGESLAYAGVDDQGVCPCCDVASLREADGRALLAFRHNRDGYRDIYVTRASETTLGAFEDPVPVSADHWKLDGCPHDGPTLARIGDTLHVAWMNGHEGKKKVYLASAKFSDLQFAQRTFNPSPVGEQGHPKLTALGDALHLVWDEALPGVWNAPEKEETAEDHKHLHGSPMGSGRAIAYTVSSDKGATFSSPRMLEPKDGVFQTHPSVAVSASGAVFITWSELSDEGRSVALVRVSPEGAACCSSCTVKPAAGDCCAAPGRSAAIK